MLLPVPSVIAVIQDERLEIIHAVGKFRFRRLVLLEFIEDRRKFLFLVFGKKGKYPLFGSVFARFLCGQPFGVIGIGIADIDLDNVMDQARPLKKWDYFDAQPPRILF